MLQSSKTSPWGRLACTSVICWEKGPRGSGAMWAANWRINSAPDQVSTPSWFSSEYEGAIEICSQSKLWHFLLFYGRLPFPHSNADGSPTYWMSNGHTMDFLPKVTWSQLGPWIQQSQFSEYYKTNKQVLHCDLYSDETTMLGSLGIEKTIQAHIAMSAFGVPWKFGCIWLWLLSASAHRQKKNCKHFADFSVPYAWNYTLTQIYPASCIELNLAQDYPKLHQSFLKAL